MTVYYTPTENPPVLTRGASGPIRDEFDAIEAGFAAVNTNVTALQLGGLGYSSGTSTTSFTLALGSKAFTIVESNRLFAIGLSVLIASISAPDVRVVGIVTAWANPVVTVNVVDLLGNTGGPFSDWSLAVSGPGIEGPGDHEVTVCTGDGHGSVNTKIRKFTTTVRNVGTAITYATSAGAGASFTINTPGLYELLYADNHVNTTELFAATLNCATLTTDAGAITDIAIRLMHTRPAVGATSAVTRTVRLSVGDAIRPHTNGLTTNTETAGAMFSIRKTA